MDTLIIILLCLATIAAVIWVISDDSSPTGKREKSRGASNRNRKPKHPEHK